jgi:CspA family cold shock protein
MRLIRCSCHGLRRGSSANFALQSRSPRGARIKRRSKVPSGTVKWFNVSKGDGFIAPARGGKDVFVHIKAVRKAGSNGLVQGGKVAFDVVEYRGKQPRKICG